MCVLLGVACITFAASVRAHPRLAIAANACASDSQELERRLPSALDGRGSPRLSASVSLEASDGAIRVTVAVREGSVPRGETALVVSSCEEAVDAAVVVLALAFSATASDAERDDDALTATRRHAGAAAPAVPDDELSIQSAQPSAGGTESLAAAKLPFARRSSQVSLAGGVDVGTMPTASAFLAGGVTHSLSVIDLRGSLRYGLPTEDEQVEAGFDQSVRRDYGAMGLSACYGVGVGVRLLACAGGELSLVRLAQRVEIEGRSNLEQDEVFARVSGVLGAVLSRRRGWLQPELELAGSAVAVGRRTGAAPIALRAAAGAAVSF
jgi:hypothetical protein